MEIPAGTCVKFKNLKTAPEYNGQYGVVKKQLPNGNYRVRLTTGGDRGLPKENLALLNQCPNQLQNRNVGLVCWAKLYEYKYPSVHWLDNNDFVKNFQGIHEMIKPDSPYAEKHLILLKTLLGWKSPKMWWLDGDRNNVRTIIYYDKDSDGAKNEWLEAMFRYKSNVPKINGAFVYYNDYIEKNNAWTNRETMELLCLNVLRSTFYFYEQVDVERLPYEMKGHTFRTFNNRTMETFLKEEDCKKITQKKCKTCNSMKRKLGMTV